MGRGAYELNKVQNEKLEILQILEGVFIYFQVIVNQKHAFQGHNKMIQGLFMPLFLDYCSQSRIHFMLFQHDAT